MDRLKKLMEQRAELIAAMKTLNEERKFEEFNIKDGELKALDAEIAAEKRLLEIANEPIDINNDEEVTLESEIRRAWNTKDEVDISNFEVEVRDGEMTIGGAPTGGKSVGNIKKTTFADYIIKRLPYISKLYGACRREELPSASHAIPVQKTRLGKFVKLKELQEYVKNNADYEQIKMEPNKYGTLVVVSDELVEDTGYDIVSDVKDQIYEGYAETVDELIVTGDPDIKVHGLNSFSDRTGAKKFIQITSGAITIDEIESIYYALPLKYRNNATWVFNDDTARALNGLKDANGQPFLKPSSNGAPFGEGSTLMGRPVIVNEYVASLNAGAGKKPIFFGDLQKCIIVGPRKSLTLKQSEEFGFLNDSKAIKANVRLDIKKALEEAMAYYEAK